MGWVLLAARDGGLSMIPHHLFWGRLHDHDPTIQMLADGVHATDQILYGISTMSFVSATGETAAVDGLSDTDAAISDIAETCLRQWATLQE